MLRVLLLSRATIPSNLSYYTLLKYASHLAGFYFERWYRSLDFSHYLFLHYMARCGCCRVVRLSLGRRLVNHLPVTQRTNALTNGVVGRTMGRWS